MNINLSKWMEKADDSRNLLSLDMPGAHDCAANNIQLSHFTKCQDTDIYGLLSLGVRVLDSRVEVKENDLIMVHWRAKTFVSSEKGARLQMLGDVIKQIKRFLKDNPSETVILQFKNDSGERMEDCYDILYHRYICNDRDLWYTENRIPSIGEVRGKIVLFRRCKMYGTNKPYTPENSGIDLSRWRNQDETVPFAEQLETFSDDRDVFIVQDRYTYRPVPRWRDCVKPFLDAREAFGGKYILCYLSTAGGLKGPKGNAKYINAKFLDYPLEKDKYYGVVYFDFPTKEVTKKLIENNF